MATFVKLLPLEMKQINAYIEPEDEVKPSEIVIGDMSDDQKALYTLSRYKAKEALDISANLMICRDHEQEKKAQAEALRAKARLLMEIFWVSVKDDFNLWQSTDTLGVRRGFKVVSYKQAGLPLPDFFKGLFGFE